MKNQPQAKKQPNNPPHAGQSQTPPEAVTFKVPPHSDSSPDAVHNLIDEAVKAARATCTLLDMFSARLVEALSVDESLETDLLYQGVRTLSQRQREFLNEKIGALTSWSIEVRYLRHD